jgi:hypothetical protein
MVSTSIQFCAFPVLAAKWKTKKTRNRPIGKCFIHIMIDEAR